MIISTESIQGSFNKAAKYIERMSETRTNCRAARVTDVLTSVVLLAAGLHRAQFHPASALLTIVSGLLIYTLVEYCFHRWLFHGTAPFLEPGHRRHHENPLGDDAMPFFLPPLAILGLVAVFSLVIPAGFALLFIGSLAGGYAIYGLSHALIHNTRFRHPLTKRWAASHHIHHFHPDRNFGVTTPLWDIVLGTRYSSKRSASHARSHRYYWSGRLASRVRLAPGFWWRTAPSLRRRLGFRDTIE